MILFRQFQPNRDNKSPLQLSIEFNRDNIVEWLINKRTETGLMVTNDDLFYAINSERMFMVTTVAKVIGDYYQRNAAGQTPLQFARIVNKPKIEKFLRKKTLMSILMENKSEEEKLKLLQEHLGSQNAGSYEKIDVNKIDRRNENIVIYEAQQKCMKIVKWLVENGADPNSKSRSGTSSYKCIFLIFYLSLSYS